MPAAANPLLTHIARFVSLSASEEGAVLAAFEARNLRKKEVLVKEGRPCRTHAFVARGCLRLFYLKENGTEQTIQFALENWWLTDYAAFPLGAPSAYTMQAVEPAEVLLIDPIGQEALLAEVPILERYFRLLAQRATAAAQHRIRLLYEHSREALYRQFSAQFPDFVQRVPQYLLASFLGVTPEYLSEIRRKPIS